MSRLGLLGSKTGLGRMPRLHHDPTQPVQLVVFVCHSVFVCQIRLWMADPETNAYHRHTLGLDQGMSGLTRRFEVVSAGTEPMERRREKGTRESRRNQL